MLSYVRTVKQIKIRTLLLDAETDLGLAQNFQSVKREEKHYSTVKAGRKRIHNNLCDQKI